MQILIQQQIIIVKINYAINTELITGIRLLSSLSFEFRFIHVLQVRAVLLEISLLYVNWLFSGNYFLRFSIVF